MNSSATEIHQGWCGWYCPRPHSIFDAYENLASMAAGLAGNTQPRYKEHFNSNDSRQGIAVNGDDFAQSTDGLTATIAGLPYWSNSRLAEVADHRGHAQALIEGYRRYGTEVLSHLHGAFAVALVDSCRDQVLLAIDRLGQQSLYYAPIPGGLAFGTTADSVRGCTGVDSEIDLQGLYNYFYFHMVPSPGTIYRTQHKLPAGHRLLWKENQLFCERYWLPHFTESSSVNVRQLGEEMLEIIEGAVGRLSDIPQLGAFLSGGLDSSTVAGMLARHRPDSASTYSMGFAVPGYDEIEYARLASRHFGTRQQEYYLTPEDAVSAIPEIASFYDEPFGNSSALPTLICARMARADGVSRLLAGDGGDELFAGNERYAKQGLFEAYFRLPASVRHYLLEAPLASLPGLSRLPLVRKADSYIRQANIPLPDRLETYNFLHLHRAEEVFSADLLAQVNSSCPLELIREHYQAPRQASPLNRLLYLDWQRTLHDNDLVKVNRMCQLAGVQVAYPMLDDRLVEFSCRIPSHLKLKPRRLRWFYKQATKSFLPQAILNKQKHGFGLPFGIWIADHPQLQSLAYDNVLSLRYRGYFRTDFLHRVIDMHRNVHASYYGELVWILMMLNLWLESHVSGTRPDAQHATGLERTRLPTNVPLMQNQ